MKHLLKFLSLFFTKRDEPVDILASRKILVICNIINHESLLASMMLKPVFDEMGIEMSIVDIRHPLSEADAYLWLGVGTSDRLEDFYYSSIVRTDKMEAVFKKSIMINAVNGVSLLQLVGDILYDFGIEDGRHFYRWSMVSRLFHTNQIEEPVLVRYYQLLEHAWHCYWERDSFAWDISKEASEEEINEFRSTQQRLNTILEQRILQHRDYAVFTINDPTVFGLIRRFELMGKKFSHDSMSVYGRVICSNTDKAFEAVDEYSSVLMLRI